MLRIFPIVIIALLFMSLKSPLTLKIEISDLKNSKGLIQLELQDENKNVIKQISQAIVNNKCTIIIRNMHEGRFTYRYFHDENSNKELDTNLLGIPKEGFGFSNNAKGLFGPPSHEKTIFEFTQDTLQNCTPIYL